jgi:glycine hydroxymethyltransferase
VRFRINLFSILLIKNKFATFQNKSIIITMKDKRIQNLIKNEEARQKSVVNLIASENYVSQDVLDALGSVLNNKYSEGYPGARYYAGNKIIDQVEDLCQKRALDAFELSDKKWKVNVQALSGSPANFAVYTALISVGGKIMGMSLDHGGHLTHGHKVSASGIFWKQIPYGVDAKTEKLNYDEVAKIAKKNKPNIIVAGYTAYPRRINWKKMREIADSVGAILMVDMSHISGLVAGKAYPTPFKYADVVTTTTHKTLRGPRSALIFSRVDKKDDNGKNFPTKIDKAVFPGLQGGPHENQIAAVAVALKEAKSPAFKKYAKQIILNADALSNELKRLGWRIVSGGTDSHLILVDVWNKGEKTDKGVGGVTGKRAESALEKSGIIVNKNTIPNDKRKPTDPSGIRLGVAAETTRGAKERDFIKIARRIDEILRKAL